ncbi:hypothetical protein EYF80_016527 [Liparis tanakae]|uniref:Uncharacterized protein n=1 Tax=Liparis tanakae TaxID=230148 RepID=A0A4Z2I7R6_9TELE|nr:hypothetical protein EYF80_016527 [Liparis tanakae]
MVGHRIHRAGGVLRLLLLLLLRAEVDAPLRAMPRGATLTSVSSPPAAVTSRVLGDGAAVDAQAGAGEGRHLDLVLGPDDQVLQQAVVGLWAADVLLLVVPRQPGQTYRSTYPRRTPLSCSSGGGCHCTMMDWLVRPLATMFFGGALGASSLSINLTKTHTRGTREGEREREREGERERETVDIDDVDQSPGEEDVRRLQMDGSRITDERLEEFIHMF